MWSRIIAEIPPDVVVARVDDAHVDRVRALRLAALANSPTDFASSGDEAGWGTAAWREWIATHRAVWLATRRGSDVGLAALEDAWDEADVFYVSAVWVTPAERGTGVAGALLKELIAEASRRAARMLRLDVGAANTHARAFYERHGFHAGDTHVTPRGTSELAMSRPLPR